MLGACLRLFACFAMALLIHRAAAADFSVTSPGSYYAISGLAGNNPTLTLIRGETYTFAINTSSIHPFRINSPGAVPSGGISSGTITYKVPTNAANYTYYCTIHGFGGTILTVPPPTFRIVRLTVSTNLVLKSTGTNNWTVFPQFSTNLASTNWLPLTINSNRFVNGTNEIFCGKPPGTNVFVRLRAQRN
jgi:hypothetical protein